ncbi:hypothetical protein BDZ89DRAFT_1158013 [Hymenopellis radicata]|nr:hypothetical protein BDZ89DRAFT_1158013 [Hymenopellis radicata]
MTTPVFDHDHHCDMTHSFASLTPAQVRSQPRQTVFTDAQQALQSDVDSIVGDIKSRSPIHITLLELQKIMDYKLTFGQNRPALRALIKKNSATQVKEVTERALRESLAEGTWDSLKLALDILCELKGVGPATASLILSLIYPRDIPFFSDEATVDVLALVGGRKAIKYTHATYRTLYDALEDMTSTINQNAPSEDSLGRGELERAIWHSVRLKDSTSPVVKSSKRKLDADEREKPPKRKRTKRHVIIS